jgi:hypothetical protein
MLNNSKYLHGSTIKKDETDNEENDVTSTKTNNYNIFNKDVDINYKPAQDNQAATKVYTVMSSEFNENCLYSENNKAYYCFSNGEIYNKNPENYKTINNTINTNKFDDK